MELYVYLGQMMVGALIVAWLTRALVAGVRAIFFGALD